MISGVRMGASITENVHYANLAGPLDGQLKKLQAG